MPELLVVDLSHHNAVHDFAVAAANGLVGVIHKATEGTTFTDGNYWHRWEAARAAGLCWGSYHYLRHGQIGAQIDNYLSFADPDPGERVVIDYEQGDCDLVDLHLAVEAILAADPSLQIAIYGGHLLKEQIGQAYDPVLSPHALWIAHYTASDTPVWPQGTWPAWSLWQYSDGEAGGSPRSIPGIGTPHDCNAFNGSAEQCRKWFGPVGAVVPVPEPVEAEVLVEVTATPGVRVSVIINGEAR